MNCVEDPNKKSYYKSAELSVHKPPVNKELANRNNSRMYYNNNNTSIISNQVPTLTYGSGSVINDSPSVMSNFKNNNQRSAEIVANIDIGQLILNEKLRDGSKDSSPMISGKRQLSQSSAEDYQNQEQVMHSVSTFKHQDSNQIQLDLSPTLKMSATNSYRQP